MLAVLSVGASPGLLCLVLGARLAASGLQRGVHRARPPEAQRSEFCLQPFLAGFAAKSHDQVSAGDASGPRPAGTKSNLARLNSRQARAKHL